MGKPVANAKTTVRFPGTGTWNVWVRTRDWCPGEWAAPGRFKLKIGGKELESEFGTEQGWAWQQGGKAEVGAPEMLIDLVDLTGFDGRCDAVLFTRD